MMFGYDGYGCGMGGWGMGMMAIMMLVWFLLIVIVAYALIHWLNSTRSPRRDEKTDSIEKMALKILDERYAKGEIDREDFLQRREDLTRNRNGQ